MIIVIIALIVIISINIIIWYNFQGGCNPPDLVFCMIWTRKNPCCTWFRWKALSESFRWSLLATLEPCRTAWPRAWRVRMATAALARATVVPCGMSIRGLWAGRAIYKNHLFCASPPPGPGGEASASRGAPPNCTGNAIGRSVRQHAPHAGLTALDRRYLAPG